MGQAFSNSKFKGDISKWNTSEVKDMYGMFTRVENMNAMFINSKFTGDISKWNVSKVFSMVDIFTNKDNDKPWWAIEDYELRQEAIIKQKLMQKIDNKLQQKITVQSKKNKI